MWVLQGYTFSDFVPFIKILKIQGLNRSELNFLLICCKFRVQSSLYVQDVAKVSVVAVLFLLLVVIYK